MACIAIAAPANGDILIRSGGAWVSLPKGDDDKILKMVSGLPAWAAAPGGAIPAGLIAMWHGTGTEHSVGVGDLRQTTARLIYWINLLKEYIQLQQPGRLAAPRRLLPTQLKCLHINLNIGKRYTSARVTSRRGRRSGRPGLCCCKITSAALTLAQVATILTAVIPV